MDVEFKGIVVNIDASDIISSRIGDAVVADDSVTEILIPEVDCAGIFCCQRIGGEAVSVDNCTPTSAGNPCPPRINKGISLDCRGVRSGTKQD